MALKKVVREIQNVHGQFEWTGDEQACVAVTLG